MDPSDDESFEEQLGRFVATSQILVMVFAQWARVPREGVESLCAALPRWRSPAEFLVLRSLLVEFAVRALRSAPDGLAKVLPLATVQPTGDLAGRFVDCLSETCATESGATRSLQQARAWRAMEIITARCRDRDVTAGAVARTVGVSPDYLAKLLHLHHGCGFRTALRRARISHARTLLERTFSSMKEISAMVGYASTSQFDRDFRRELEVSPGEYRRRHLARSARQNHSVRTYLSEPFVRKRSGVRRSQ